MATTELGSEVKKGTSEILILSILEDRPRHGYEIAKLIERRTCGLVDFHVASLYPMLYRLERRGWIEGKWVEKAGQRRRRFYKLSALGRKALPEQRRSWRELIRVMERVALSGG
jgi:PadR family transcriptional regulator, regulatory protein PadR